MNDGLNIRALFIDFAVNVAFQVEPPGISMKGLRVKIELDDIVLSDQFRSQ